MDFFTEDIDKCEQAAETLNNNGYYWDEIEERSGGDKVTFTFVE